MATRKEVIVADRTVEEIREEIDANSLAYLSREAVADVLKIDQSDLCMGCVTGEYSYDIADD